jgi:hypothetical protein
VATFTPKELVYPVFLTSNTGQLLYTATGVKALVQTIHFQRSVFPSVDPVDPLSPGIPIQITRETPTEATVIARAIAFRGWSLVKNLTVVIPSGGTLYAKITPGFPPPSASAGVWGYEIS